MKTFLIRGVPHAIQQDGWWLNGPDPERRDHDAQAGEDFGMWRALVLVALIALGDVLVWDVAAGLSLAVFGGCLVLAALWVAGGRMTAQHQALVCGGSVLALLPLVELVQPLSVMIALGGLSALLAVVAGLRPAELARGALRLWPSGVRQTCVDGFALAEAQGKGGKRGLLTRLLMSWFMPLSLGLVFVLLLLLANPIADQWLGDLVRRGIGLPALDRVLFWLVLVPVGWTALSLMQMRERLRAAPAPKKMGPARNGLINPASVVRALVIFNAVFAVQTVMDVIYLYGGVGLPDGISYAQYAHRGAYPLVVTGLLAGGFALLTRRWVQGNRVLRAMLMLWVAQNVALVVSSIVRLDMYVDSYGLTHLRMAAGIWMGLTAAGLALILWQIWKRRDNAWLVLRGGAMSVVVLYVCAFVSFDRTIAAHNLSKPLQKDYHHLCTLGDAAKPVIAAYEIRTRRILCEYNDRSIRAPRDWREWGFRNWRARTSLAAIQAEALS